MNLQLNKICISLLMAFTSLTTLAAEHTLTISPQVPKKVKFADRDINLDRIDMAERMDRELISFMYGQTNTMLTIKRANRYLPEIVKVLKEQGVDPDMAYIAAIESNYDNTAVSGAKAAGMWQFMPSTAKEYGLEVNDWVDERYDCEKSTVAACKYFKRAYSKYNCWVTVAASYNAGMGRISKALEAQDVETAFDLYLNKETSRYIFRLLAIKLIIEHPERYCYSIRSAELYKPLTYKIYEVNTPVDDWVAWAKDHNVTYSLLREYNPWIRSTSLPNKDGKMYKVKIPEDDCLYRSKH